MLSIGKQVFCLLAFLFTIFYPSLEIKADESIEIAVEIEQNKTEVVSEMDTRPIIEVETLVCEKITEEDLEEEIRFGEMELIAQLVQAEAGNQDLTGKRYVVDVVLNRVDSEEFPNTVEEVIFQDGQFSVIKNGAFAKAEYNISEECYEAVLLEYEERLNYDILYFSRGKSRYASNHFKWQDHWFGW